MTIALLVVSGCKSASDTNRAPLITSIKAMDGATPLTELARDSVINLKVEYTDEDYSSSGQGDMRFIPDVAWTAKFDGTTNSLNSDFTDPTVNPSIFNVPDLPGMLRIEVTLTDRYGDASTGHLLIEIKENSPPLIRDFTVEGTKSDGLIPQAARDTDIEIEVKYIDDDYDPDSQDPDPLKKPTFEWTAAWNDTGVSLNDGFFDRFTDPVIFSTPDQTGFIKFSVVVTDRDGLEAQDDFIIEISDNEPPVITSLDLGNVVFHISLERTLKVVAADPDGDVSDLTYEWGADGGSYTTQANLATVKWRGNTIGIFNLFVIVTDKDGGWDREDFTLQTTNAAPQITGYTIDDKNPIPGATVTITLDVTDPDTEDSNADLTYEWDATGGGFQSEVVTTSGAEAEWLAPQTEGNYTISVTVRDPWGGTDTLDIPPVTVENAPG